MSITEREFNLQPTPRILPMLGEIKLPEWRCVAELVDNAVDGFLAIRRAGEDISGRANPCQYSAHRTPRRQN